MDRIRQAIRRIRPLPGDGPNRWAVNVEGWGLSAPTKRELCRMIWAWSNPRPSTVAALAAAAAAVEERAHG